jgi:hypothetical protein
MLRAIILILFISACSLELRPQDLPGERSGNGDMVSVTSIERKKNHKNRIVESKYVTRVLPDPSPIKGVNVFLIGADRPDDTGLHYHGTFTTFNKTNSFEKINDSLYEIIINNPEQDVLFAAQKNNKYIIYTSYGSPNEGLSSPDLMGGQYDSLVIVDHGKKKAFQIIPFNPFLNGLQLKIAARSTGTDLVTFKILFRFPRPKLIGLSKDSGVVNSKKLNPGSDWNPSVYRNVNLMGEKKLTIGKAECLVFYFEHFGSFFRRDYMDRLQYKLDDAPDWTSTALAYHPSILLEHISPGRHTLYVKYPVGNTPPFTYDFQVTAPVFSLPVFWIITGILLSGIGFWAVYKNRLRIAGEKAQKSRLKLQAIQSQLNPHFMFNTLASVQYLMNNNEKQKANTYLTELGALLRNSLSNNENELVPLSKELQVLNSYIKLEQLRFGFRYQLRIDDALEPGNISIPTLLIQPLVENAIKHGAAPLLDKGEVEIAISKQNDYLLLRIKDNGPGFSHEKLFSGLGTKLVRERIALLQNDQLDVEITFSSNLKDETNVSLIFNNWL